MSVTGSLHGAPDFFHMNECGFKSELLVGNKQKTDFLNTIYGSQLQNFCGILLDRPSQLAHPKCKLSSLACVKCERGV